MKPTVLALIPAYLPGYKAGGSIRTLVNLVERLNGELDFKVITADRDFGETEPYPSVEAGCWARVGAADVHYLSDGASTGELRRLLRDTPHDVLYLNSSFHPGLSVRVLVLRRLGLLRPTAVVIAPRGELARGALSSKRFKKQWFMRAARLVGLHRGVVWQASTEAEREDIIAAVGRRARVVVARDLLPLSLGQAGDGVRRPKKQGLLRAITVTRISPEKNVRQSIELLAGVRGEVHFSIYGLIDNDAYWRQCQESIRRLPANIKVDYRGAVAYEQVQPALREHDLFFMPTLGENFGHAILEALVAGCPLLISDRTPWRDLERAGVGWDLPLEDPGAFVEKLETCVSMTDTDHEVWSRRAAEHGRSELADDAAVNQNRRLFRNVLEGTAT